MIDQLGVNGPKLPAGQEQFGTAIIQEKYNYKLHIKTNYINIQAYHLQ